jgi:energy-coupling factor transporter transmembrane protein EcfT
MTAEGVRTGIDRGLRLFGFVGLGQLASRWIDFGMLADSITQLGGRKSTTATGAGRAGRGARMYIERAALALALAMRFIPEVIDEARRLELAMRSRPRPRALGRWQRWQALAPLFIPLVAGTIRRADEVALTLDARGFATGERTSRLESPGSSRRLWVMAAVGALVGATLYVTR